MGLLSPFTDVLQATVAGSKGHRILYNVLVGIGLIIFLNGFMSAMSSATEVVTVTEILPSPLQVDFPIVFG